VDDYTKLAEAMQAARDAFWDEINGETDLPSGFDQKMEIDDDGVGTH